MTERLAKLAGFIKALEDIGFNFNVNRFNHRLKLQKYVYLARRYGIDLGYYYNLYIRGPYSPELANDYYSIKEGMPRKNVDPPKDFFRLVKGKSERWLELAATLVMIKERYPDISDEEMIDLVIKNKPFATTEELKDILKKLKKYNAI
jgi:uncharacterized protein YwgA